MLRICACASLRRSPLVGADLNPTRAHETGRKTDNEKDFAGLKFVNPLRA